MKVLNQHEDTIIAQCTPQGRGALALLRISGTDAWIITDSFAKLANKKKLSECETHTIQFGEVVDSDGNSIDQVLFLLMRGPRTFTGVDTVEITCHNNPFIIDAIINVAIGEGARVAQQGEFSRRAVANGKIDLLQAEAINELIQAHTTIVLKQSLSQVQGSLSSWIISLEQSLLKAYAFCEASFEFTDDEMEFAGDIRTIIQAVLCSIEKLEKTFDQQQHIRQGIRIAIIGSVNTGKSSLFNALLAKERAIVTPIPGTTRDTIEAGIYKDGNYWTLIDTAGLRQTADTIEQQGIERSYQEAQQADVIVLVADSSRIMSEQEQAVYRELMRLHNNKIVLVYNKADLPQVESINTILRNRETKTADRPELVEGNDRANALSWNRSHALRETCLLREASAATAGQASTGCRLRQPVLRSFSEVEGFDGQAARTGLDDLSESDIPVIPCSCLKKENISAVYEAIAQKIDQLLATIDVPYLLNQRQFNLILSLKKELIAIDAMLQGTVQYELLAVHLKDSLAALSTLTGKSVTEQMLDEVFKQFCVGK